MPKRYKNAKPRTPAQIRASEINFLSFQLAGMQSALGNYINSPHVDADCRALAKDLGERVQALRERTKRL